MSWIREDPQRLLGSEPTDIRSQSSSNGANPENQKMVAVADLKAGKAGLSPLPASPTPEPGDRHWSRFIDHVLAAFREHRGPLGGNSSGRKGDDDDDVTGGRSAPATDLAIERSLRFFPRLLEKLLSPADASRHAITAFDLTQYVCERLGPDAATAGRAPAPSGGHRRTNIGHSPMDTMRSRGKLNQETG
jgi:hypothetical protein